MNPRYRCSGKVFDWSGYKQSYVDSSLNMFWLTTGRFATAFEKRFARLRGLRSATLVNFGLFRQRLVAARGADFAQTR